eukprot:750896-Hanusia_phi.AAC.2
MKFLHMVSLLSTIACPPSASCTALSPPPPLVRLLPSSSPCSPSRSPAARGACSGFFAHPLGLGAAEGAQGEEEEKALLPPPGMLSHEVVEGERDFNLRSLRRER